MTQCSLYCVFKMILGVETYNVLRISLDLKFHWKLFNWNFPFSFSANMIFNVEVHFWCIFSFLQHLTPQSRRIWDKNYFFLNLDKKNVYKTYERRKIIFNNECHSSFFFVSLYNISGEFTLVWKHISSLSFDGWEVYKTVGRKNM